MPTPHGKSSPLAAGSVPILAYILAGGRSSRFGTDKARACLEGEPLVLRQAHQLESLGFPVTIVARRAGEYADLGLTTIGDLELDQGPAGGAITALRHRGSGWLILSSCDLVVLRREWLEQLVTAAAAGDIDAVACFSDRWQPFPGLYHTRLLQQPAAWSNSSLQHVLNSARSRRLPLPSDWPAMVQVNTREDLHRVASAGVLRAGASRR